MEQEEGGSGDNAMSESPKHKEIYTYTAPWTTYALAFSRKGKDNNGNEEHLRLAVGSFKEEYSNQIHVIDLKRDEKGFGNFSQLCSFEHPYPATKIMWTPATEGKDLLATTGDYLRIWGLNESNQVELKGLLNNNRHTEYCAPLTSFDWNDVDHTLIGVSSIDTTCTMWDLTKMVPRTQLIAHDKEVYDISFSNSKDNFATCGADGSVRLFDLRTLEHSTILYETNQLTPLLRVSWNKSDPNYIATFKAISPTITVLDVRMASAPLVEMTAHTQAVNGVAWAPNSPCHMCSVSDDRDALIWDIAVSQKVIDEPILSYRADSEINQLQWDRAFWVGICYSNNVQVLRV